MPLPESVRKQCRAFLEPGDELRYLVPATMVGINAMTVVTRYLLMVSDRYITVIACSKWRVLKPKSVVATHPRRTRMGPVEVHPSVGAHFTFGGINLEIDEEYVSVVRAADLELAGREAQVQDPLPDL